MRFTVSRLHKRLGELIQQGHARKPVAIDKTSFQHNCEGDGVTILDLEGLDVEMIPQADDDGGTKINADGSESYRQTCVLVGGMRANAEGRIVAAPPLH